MFSSRTLFVVGAGASSEAGLPTGPTLAGQIAPKLDLRFQQGNLESGSYSIAHALRLLGKGNLNPFLPAARRISAGVALSNSIDTFLDLHQDDENVRVCGKLGIAETIMDAERASPLFVEHRAPHRASVAKRVPDSWYLSFFKILNDRVPKTQVASLFQDVRVISFNYDRCIEYFLAEAIADTYGVDQNEAQEIVAGLNVQHPYGSIGSLPAREVPNAVPFGGLEDDTVGLLRVSQGLRTFTEKIEDKVALNAIRNEVASAETIVFLGFAFHPMNIELLAPTVPTAARRVYATALGVSEADCDVIAEQISGMLTGPGPREIHVRRGMSCSALFAEYWRTFSLR